MVQLEQVGQAGHRAHQVHLLEPVDQADLQVPLALLHELRDLVDHQALLQVQLVDQRDSQERIVLLARVDLRQDHLVQVNQDNQLLGHHVRIDRANHLQDRHVQIDRHLL